MALKPIRVSQVNSYIKRILQSDPILGNVPVIGEISNLKYHGSGHVYFTLKDENSKINCFLSADNLRHIRYELTDGMEITAAGFISVYERGGYYSLNVRDIIVEGTGNLSIAFQQLKDKLEKEGLFAPEHKKPIPFFPKKIAVLTSETGAAVRDVIKIIKSRNNIVDVLVYPCLVQGPAAAADIAEALDEVNLLFPEVDTIIVGRGGGSMEELWAFNEEVVARSIFRSRIPVISAVGHETDFTIADFVADRRAETPTAAAQLAAPDIEALKGFVDDTKAVMSQGLERVIRHLELRINACNMDALSMRLQNRLRQSEMTVEAFKQELKSGVKEKMMALEHRLERLYLQLEGRNPSRILELGYGIVLDSAGQPAASAKGFDPGDGLTVVLRDGRVSCTVLEVTEEAAKPGMRTEEC